MDDSLVSNKCFKFSAIYYIYSLKDNRSDIRKMPK